MKRQMLKKIANIACVLAVAIAPVASEYCRFIFFQPEEPEGLAEFAKSKKHQAERVEDLRDTVVEKFFG